MSLYQLTIEENTAFHHAYKNGGFTLPDEEEAVALYLLTEEILQEKGLRAYEVSNYAKPGEESRHNMSYWKGDDYIGVGPGAHGRISMDVEDWRCGDVEKKSIPSIPTSPYPHIPLSPLRIATATLKSPERWLSQVEEKSHAIETWQAIDREQEIAERLMMGLRLSEGINYSVFETKTGLDLRNYLDAKKVALFKSQNLLLDRPEVLQATLRGRLVLNRLLAELQP
jgi:oxygen-independent coproporphyrinogen-3 oxidase